MIKKIIKKILKDNPKDIDEEYLRFDKRQVYRTNNIQNIPNKKHRTGGKNSYAEWAHIIGIFQTIIYQQLSKKNNNNFLDVGCGTGLVSMAAQNYIGENGVYIGLDINKDEIEFCKEYYKHPNFIFKHTNSNNAFFANEQKDIEVKWDLENSFFDLVSALSVWTHLNEKDSIYYFKEISRVLKKNGKAIITFFYLDDLYKNTLNYRKDVKGKFHSTSQTDWIFDKKVYGST